MGMGNLGIDHAQVGQVTTYIKNNSKNNRTSEEKPQKSVDIQNSDLSAFRRVDGGISFYGNIMPNNVSLRLVRQNSGIDVQTTSFQDTIKYLNSHAAVELLENNKSKDLYDFLYSDNSNIEESASNPVSIQSVDENTIEEDSNPFANGIETDFRRSLQLGIAA